MRYFSLRTSSALMALAAIFMLYLAPVATPQGEAAAQTLYCPPGFESLPGCGGGGGGGAADDGNGEWRNESIGGMNVNIYVPPLSETPAKMIDGKRALMINLHGCAQTATDMKNGANWPGTADEYGMIVAAPDAPNGGVIFGCWDYYDSNHTRGNRHNDNLISLVNNLLSRSEFNIDPDQVYISGLSSGGGETMVMGCLAPDLFAGIGINAGPTVGTGSSQIGSVQTSKSAGKSTCLNFAGSRSGDFSTQLTSVIYGNNDSTVAPGYNTLNAQIMADIYNANSTSSFSLSNLDGNNTNGSGTLYSDSNGPRVSIIQNSGMGHNWPAGEGSGGSYITTNSIDYPAYVTAFFFDNNRRVDGTTTPDDPTDPDEPTDPEEPTDPDTGHQCTETRASNYSHVSAGRAQTCNWWYACAVGSGDNLGANNIYTYSTLAETAPGHYEKGNCP